MKQTSLTNQEAGAVLCAVNSRIGLVRDVLDNTGYWAEGERESYVRELENLQAALPKLRVVIWPQQL